MAFISCPECGSQCSDQAVSCPNCGFIFSSLNKCEECGAVLDPGKAACPQCGCPTNQVPPVPPQPPQQQYIPPQQQYQQPAQQPYTQQSPQSLANVPASDGTGTRIIIFLAGVLLAAMPFIGFYSVAGKWDFSLVSLLTEVWDFSKLFSRLGIGLSDRSLSQLSSVFGFPLVLCFLSLFGGYLTLIASLVDITGNTEQKAIKFWNRISYTMVWFFIYAAVLAIALLMISDAFKDDISQATFGIVNIDLFTVSPFHYIFMIVALAGFIFARAQIKKSRISLRNSIGLP